MLGFITRWVASALISLLASASSSRLNVHGLRMVLLVSFLVAAAQHLRWFL
jgi:hypothetical protein